MRILELSTFFNHVGGAEIYMHQVAAGLAERGHDVAMFAGSPDQEIDEPLLRVVKRPDFNSGALIEEPALIEALRSFVDQFKPDVVHLHNTYNFPADIVTELVGMGLPIFQMVHDWSLLCPNGWCVVPETKTEKARVCEGVAGQKCFDRGCESNYPFDSRIVLASIMKLKATRDGVCNFAAPSGALAKTLNDNDLGPAHTLPLWIDPESFGGLEVFEKALVEVEREPHRMLFVGRIEREKGLAYVVEAMPTILKEFPDARFSLVGGGAVVDELKASVAKLGVEHAVEFHGKIPHDDVVRHLARASVQVLPSIWCENSPLTCYESLLAGLPMAASDIAGLPAMVRPGETGVLFEPRNSKDVAAKLIGLFKDPELHAKLVEGCKQDVARYSKKAHLDQLETLLAETLEIGVKPYVKDTELSKAIHGVMFKAKEIEDWAIGMHKHIQFLEKGMPLKGIVSRVARKLS